MQKISAISAGLFFVLGIIVFMVVFDLIKGGKAFQKGYELKARFETIHELKVGDPVKEAGVEIGRVKTVGIMGTNVVIDMLIQNGFDIRQDSIASIRSLGLFGQNYIGLTFGMKPGKLEPGSFVRTEERPDFDQLIARIDTVASGFEGLNTTISEAVKSFTGKEGESPFGFLKDFLTDNKASISNMLANVETITGKIKGGQGTLGKLVNDDTLYTELSQTGDNINQLVLSIRKGEGTVGKLMTDDTLYRESTGAMTDLHSVLGKIDKGQGTVGKLINDDSLIKNVKMTMQKLDKASEGIEDQGPLSVIGIAAGALF